MSRILLAYVVTRDLFDTFRRTLSFQSRFAEALHDTQSLLVSDLSAPSFGLPNVVAPQLECGENFCLAAGLSAALDYAVEKDYDWVLLLDADSVLVSHPNDFPPTGYGPTEVWKLRPD